MFLDLDKKTLESLVKRLQFALFKPLDFVAEKGKVCSAMIIFVDGKVEARDENQSIGAHVAHQVLKRRNQSELANDVIKTFDAGSSFGEQIFGMQPKDELLFPYYLQCVQRCIALTLTRKDYAEVLYFQRTNEEAEN